MHKKSNHIALWLVFAGLMLFLTMNRHSKSGYFNYHSEIWGDKAGYYMYLPAALKYGFDPAAFPDSVDVKTGSGFHLDLENQRVITKYTYGTALMQFPFYVMADLIAPVLGQSADGFAPVYHKAINLAAIFYLVMGMLLLFYFLRKSYPDMVVFLVLFSLLFGTNLYYYAIDETGMSHVYSFFLFAAFLLMMQNWLKDLKSGGWRLFVVAITAAIIFLVRPTNLIFVVFAVALHVDGKVDFWQKLTPVFRPGKLLLIILPALFLIIPQVIYWSHAYGEPTLYSYGGEGFNWLKPQIHITLCSPNNGLLLFTPYFLIILLSILRLLLNNSDRHRGLKFLILFVVISYVFSCWWVPDFGCGFGARNYVEFLGVFAVPLASLYRDMLKKPAGIQVLFWLVVLLFVVFNLKMTYSWDECFYGEGYWDWQEYFRVLTASTK